MSEAASYPTGPDGAGQLSPEALARLCRAYDALRTWAAARRRELAGGSVCAQICPAQGEGRTDAGACGPSDLAAGAPGAGAWGRIIPE
jgi:hypothetical protein